MFDVTEVEDRITPKAAGRLREIIRAVMELQVEAADIMYAEGVRLSTNVEEEMRAREVLGQWYGALIVGALRDTAEEEMRPAS